ncbi:unnamed protein product [Caretta caretta]
MEGLVVNLINIYALISGPERLRFYQQASAFLSTLDPRKCLILGRDFNTTLEEWDHLGTEQCPATADVLREIVDHHSLVDIWRDQHPDNISTFTFVRVEAHQSHHSQLDHIYLSPRQWWDLGKVCAQLFCHDYTQGTSRWRDAAIEQLEREILELERRLAASTEDPPLCEACREKREELQALKDHRARGTFVQSHIHLLWKMDHGSCFFYTLEKRRGAKKHVTCLLAEDGTPSRIRRRSGVATLFSPDLRPKVLGVAKAVSGHLLHLQVCMEGLVVNLINIYALISGPERLRFYQQASAFLSTLDPRKCLILGRDFNTTLEEWDHLGTEQCPATADVLREIVDHHSLVDIWRDQHPDNISTFTFVRVEAHQSHHSQLDHIYLSRFHLSWAHSSASSWPRSLIIIWLP